jgi:hypothetical protein
MLSAAKHLVFGDSSVAYGSLRMTREMTSHHLLLLKGIVLAFNPYALLMKSLSRAARVSGN